MNSAPIQMQLDQAVVASAYQRIIWQMENEAGQLEKVFNKPGAAKVLHDLAVKLNDVANEFIRDTQMLIKVAAELPKEAKNGA